MKNIQLPSLTSLRFFAALMVFFSHMGMLRIHKDAFGNPDHYQDFYNTWLYEGYSGVTFFFILSGFILAHSYQDRMLDKKTSVTDFFIFRIARIVPLHWLTMAIAIFFAHKWTGNWDFFTLKSFLANVFLVQAWFSDVPTAFSYNQVSWSLSDEMFFYAMFPLLIRLEIRTLIIILGLLIIFMLAWLPGQLPFAQFHLPTYTNNGKYYAYWFPLFRIGDFITGIILYRMWRARHEIPSTIASTLQGVSLAILSLFYLAHADVTDLYRYDLYYALPMSFLIYSFAHQNGVFARMLNNRIMITLGEASFAFYMIHNLEISYIGPEIVERNPALKTLYFIPEYNVAIHFLFSLMLSLGLYFLFEKNAQRIFNKLLFSVKNLIAK